MKRIIAIDFDGTLIRNEPAKKAHIEWFKIMAGALEDNSIKEYSKIKDYFPKVYEVMSRYTGLDQKKDKELLRKFARNIFQMSLIGMANKLKNKILVREFADYLRSLKEKYTIALITTSPEDSVKPILELIKCEDIFDLIYKSSLTKEPDKKELLVEFVKDKGKPVCYIGNEGGDMIACKKLKIPSILVIWDKSADEKTKNMADYIANSVEDVKKAIKKIP